MGDRSFTLIMVGAGVLSAMVVACLTVCSGPSKDGPESPTPPPGADSKESATAES